MLPIMSLATRASILYYDHSWNKFLSYTNIQHISSIYLLTYTVIIIEFHLIYPV